MLSNPYLQSFQQNYLQSQNSDMIKMPSLSQNLVKPTLGLTQIENFKPIGKFIDSTGTQWVLSKSSFDSTKDVPDPKGVQILDYWNHEFPNVKQKLYVYVVEGTRLPRVDTEQPSRIMYQWFSQTFVPKFDPTMITEKEWLKANIYSAPIVDSRVSKLYAICHIAAPEPQASVSEDENGLLKVEELTDETA